MNIDLANISCVEELEVLARLQCISMKEVLENSENEYNVYGDLQYLVIGGKLAWFDRKTGKHVKPPKKIYEDFDCSNCPSLTSLEGAPEEVGGYFWCDNCNSLTSLKGAPKKVGGNFSCYHCHFLTSLEGAPEKVGRNFSCSYCESLTSLEGAPKKVGGDFYCADCSYLKSLKGISEEIRKKVIR